MTIRLVPEFPDYSAQFRKDRPGAMGGGCTLCRSHKLPDQLGVVELGPNARPFREGMVVLCWQCAVELGSVIGMIAPDKAALLAAERDEALARADAAEARSAGLVALRDAVVAAAVNAGTGAHLS